jgi:hypothetical protein
VPIRFLLFCVIALCLCPVVARSQSGGGRLSVDYRMGPLTFVSQQPNIVNRFNASGTGTGSEHSIGLSYRHPILGGADRIELLANGGICANFGSYRSDAFGAPAKTFSLTSQSIAAGVGAALRLPLTANFDITAGPWLLVPLSRSIEERVTGSSGDSLLATNSTERLRTSLPFGVSVGVGYHVSSRLALSADIYSDLGRIRETGQPSFSGGISVGWQLGGNNSQIAANPNDTVPTIAEPIIRYAEVDERPPLTATLTLVQDGHPVESNVAVSLTPVDTLFREYVMLPSHITDGKTLPTRRDLTNDSTVRMSPANIVSNALNIIATRLRSEPKAELTLHVGKRKIDRDIADAIERYLREPGDLQQKLHKVVSQDTGVSLDAKPVSLLDPVATQWIERTYDVSALHIVPHVFRGSVRDTDAAARVFAIVDGHQIELTRSDDSEYAFPRLVPGSVSRSVVLFAEAQDSADSVKASDTLSITYLPPSPAREAHLITRFYFVGERGHERDMRSLLAKLAETRGMNLVSADCISNGDAYCESLVPEIARAARVSIAAIAHDRDVQTTASEPPHIELTFER